LSTPFFILFEGVILFRKALRFLHISTETEHMSRVLNMVIYSSKIPLKLSLYYEVLFETKVKVREHKNSTSINKMLAFLYDNVTIFL